MSSWVKVATTDEFNTSDAKPVEVSGNAIVLFKVGDQFHAIDNYCPHAGYTLHDGQLVGTIVTCLLHGAEFDVTSGKCVGDLLCDDVNDYRVKVDDSGTVWIWTD